MKDIDKKELLQKYYDQACHNLTCYSEDILMTEPKEGYEAEWKQANEELIQLEALIKEFTGTRKLFRAWDVEEKCWIPPEMVAITGEGKILTKDDEDEEWLEEIIQVVIVY